MLTELQELYARHSARYRRSKDTRAKDVRQEEMDAFKNALDRLAYKEAEFQKLAQMHRKVVNKIKAEVAALKSKLAAARSNESLLESLLQIARDGAAKEEENASLSQMPLPEFKAQVHGRTVGPVCYKGELQVRLRGARAVAGDGGRCSFRDAHARRAREVAAQSS